MVRWPVRKGKNSGLEWTHFLFQRNKTFFQQYDPGFLDETAVWQDGLVYPVETTRRGEVTLQVEGLWVHSRVAPRKEAEKFIGNAKAGHDLPHRLHFGFGLGYYLAALIRNSEPEHSGKGQGILIFEPDPNILRTALDHLCFETLFGKSGARVFSSLKRFFTVLELEYPQWYAYPTLILPYSRKKSPGLLDRFIRKRDSLVNQKRYFKKSEEVMAPLFFASTIQSLPDVLKSDRFEPLYMAFDHMPAVVLSPGPSLEKNICDLIPVRKNVVVIAVSRVAKLLDQYGIEPDFLVHIEAQDFFSLIDGCRNLRSTIFLLQEQVEKKYFSFPCRRVVAYHNSLNRLAGLLAEHFPQLKGMSIPTGGSVSLEAFSLAVFMGFDPVILMGQDLATSGGRMYTTAESTIPDHLKEMKVPGYFGGEVFTLGNYEKFREWLQDAVVAFRDHFRDIRMINSTEGGAHIEGFEKLSMRHVAAKHLRTPLDVDAVLRNRWKREKHSRPKSSELRVLFHRWSAGVAALLQLLNAVRKDGWSERHIGTLNRLTIEKELIRAYSGKEYDEVIQELLEKKEQTAEMLNIWIDSLGKLHELLRSAETLFS